MYIEGELFSQLHSLLVPCKTLANVRGLGITTGQR